MSSATFNVHEVMGVAIGPIISVTGSYWRSIIVTDTDGGRFEITLFSHTEQDHKSELAIQFEGATLVDKKQSAEEVTA